MKNKRGIVIEALLRIIIMVVLVVVVFNIGKNVAEAFFGSSDALQSVENLANELNSNSFQNDERRQSFLSLEKGTAIIGFSKNAKDFRCYTCPQIYAVSEESLPYYSIDKPSNAECNGKACICACLKGFASTTKSDTESKVTCKSFSCKALNYDLPNKISLEDALKSRNIQIAIYPYWENGFFFVRWGGAETPSNGMGTPADIRKITIFIEKKQANGEMLVAACPAAPCIK